MLDIADFEKLLYPLLYPLPKDFLLRQVVSATNPSSASFWCSAHRPQPVVVWRSMLARKRLSSSTLLVSKAKPQTRQTCCSSERCDLSFMTISDCSGEIARNRRQHDAAQAVRGEDGRRAASAVGAQPLTARTLGQHEGDSKTFPPLPMQLPASAVRRPERAAGVSDQSRMGAIRHEARGAAREPDGGTPGHTIEPD